MNEILLSKRKATYQTAEFAKDIVGSTRLVGVTNAGVGQQKLAAKVAAQSAGRPSPPSPSPLTGGVQRASASVPSGVRASSSSGVHKVDLGSDNSSGDESLVSSNRLLSDSDSSFLLVGKKK